MSLEEWLANGWLKSHSTSNKEIQDLFALIDRDLRDCKNEQLSADWRFNIAYNAALQVAFMALAVKGYRCQRESSLK